MSESERRPGTKATADTKAAGSLLDRPLPPFYREDWARHFAAPQATPETGAGADDGCEAAFLFRIGAEWLALSTALLYEVAERRPLHSLPHRRDQIVLGLVNIRGELIVAVSLAELIGNGGTAERGARTRAFPRMLVIGRDGRRVAFPVDEVHGIHRFRDRDRLAVPATIGHAATRFTTALIAWQGVSVGRLDDDLVLDAIEASLG